MAVKASENSQPSNKSKFDGSVKAAPKISTESLLDTLDSSGHRFFVVVTPGLEDIAAEELTNWLKSLAPGSAVHFEIVRGGLEMTTSLSIACRLLHVLKVPTRILWRWADFGCKDFPKFFKRIQRLPWKLILNPKDSIRVEVSTHGSRMRMKKRIEESALEAICSSDRSLQLRPYIRSSGSETVSEVSASTQSVYIRFEQDVCWVSVDLAGEFLYRRGVRTLVGAAPLRENLAAACLLSMGFGGRAGDERSASSFPDILFDPMVGSAAFLCEAVGVLQNMHARAFRYQQFKCLNGKVSSIQAGPSLDECGVNSALAGWDQNPQVMKAAELNLIEAFQLNTPALNAVAKVKLDKARVSLREKDWTQIENLDGHSLMAGSDASSDLRSADDTGSRSVIWLVSNPPYGERLKLPIPRVQFYQNIFQFAKGAVARIGLLLPDGDDTRRAFLQSTPPGWTLISKLSFSNGGIPVLFLVFVERSGSRA